MKSTTYLITSLVGLITLIGASCTTPTPVDPVKNTNVVTTVSDTTSPELTDIDTEWSTAMQRGDADAAPSYSEFMTAMSSVSTHLQTFIATHDDASIDIVNISQRLTTALMRGDADAAPTYHEATVTIANLLQEFKVAIGQSEPLSYSTSGVSVAVSKTTAPFDYTADQLQSNATECGSQHESGYFDQLVTMFNGTVMTTYDFKYTGASQTADTFKVTLIPNTAGYTSLDQFKNDWDICATGGSLYPTMLNTDWLLFEDSCGSGFDDGSGLPIGCDEVKKVVEPSLKLNVATADTAETACATDGWERYALADVALSFCYDPAWGAPIIEPSAIGDEAKIGEYYAITFEGGEDTSLNGAEEGTFLFWYQTIDFEKTGDRDTGANFCFNCIDFAQSDEELENTLYPEADHTRIDVTRSTVDGHDALKVTGEFEFWSYYIPNAPAGYHIVLKGHDSDIAPIIESLQIE
ncbi:MAG: hypothetical protein WCV88_00730 [Patescibacteria group bacterium]